jgi:quercetin dioxygenase-like cupin family protein
MQRAANQPVTIGITIYGGLYIKTFQVFDTGTIIPQHSHSYDHVTLVMSGAVRVWRDDGPARDYCAPATVHIPAGSKHMFVTLEADTTMACLHAANTLDDDAQPSVAEENNLKLED